MLSYRGVVKPTYSGLRRGAARVFEQEGYVRSGALVAEV